MKWGQHLYGDRDYTPVGRPAGESAKAMESWDLKDKTDRMRLESEYRKYSEEEANIDYEAAERIRKAKQEKVDRALKYVTTGLGITTSILGIIKFAQGEADRNERKDKEAAKAVEESLKKDKEKQDKARDHLDNEIKGADKDKGTSAK